MGRTHICPLCAASASHFFQDIKGGQDYFVCPECDLRFVDPKWHLPPAEEVERYKLHKNDVEAVHYQNFVSPLVNAIIEIHPKNHRGLDFGCGADPILFSQLTKYGYKMETFDVFFAPDEAPLQQAYDFVATSEVVEHFYRPAEEFKKLRQLVKPSGTLGFMTLLFHPEIDFANWFYRRDPTHVAFYSKTTCEWIRRKFGFREMDVREPRTVLLRL